MNKSYLFISGAPRSGTSAMTMALNTLSNVKIGQEIFPASAKHKDYIPLKKSLFEGESLKAGVKLRIGGGDVDEEIRRYETSKVIGDKHPNYHRFFETYDDEFSPCRHVFMFRNLNDVASSFTARLNDPDDSWKLNGYRAVDYWCQGATNFLNFKRSNPDKVLGIQFDEIFCDELGESINRFTALRDTLAESLDVGEIDSDAINRVFKKSIRLRSEKKWDSDENVEELFDIYKENRKKIHWDIEKYYKILKELSSQKFLF